MAKRPTHSLPADLKSALSKRDVARDHAARLHYQRNDNVCRIMRSNLPATRDKRIRQMVAEPASKRGMKHSPSAKTR